MRFGVCGSTEEAPTFLAAGFDYVELAANPLVRYDRGVWMPDREVEARHRELRVEATNLFFAGHVSIYGPGEPWRAYVQCLIPLAASLGVRTMVVGSGGVRRAPDGEEIEYEVRFARICGEIAAMGRQHGVVIAPESLRSGETNVGNDLGRLARLLAENGVGYCADVYHVLSENASPDWRDQVPASPSHVHLSSPDRQAPSSSDRSLQAFFGRLRECRYQGRVSLECGRVGYPAQVADWLRAARALASG